MTQYYKFYDVKMKASVQAAVVGKEVYDTKTGKRYALKGKTADGRNLTALCSKETFDKF